MVGIEGPKASSVGAVIVGVGGLQGVVIRTWGAGEGAAREGDLAVAEAVGAVVGVAAKGVVARGAGIAAGVLVSAKGVAVSAKGGVVVEEEDG